MKISERVSELSSRVISKLSLKQFVDINELPLFRTPNYMFKARYWLGALVAASFIWEVITGLFLLLNYYPSNPYAQTQYLIKSIPFGAPILYSHLYGAYFMIALAYVHLFRNYFDGAYKRPRQLLWVVGIALFAITLGTAFTGYSLPADILGADADGVAQGIVAGAPLGSLINIILFGNGLSVDMYTRLLGWHIILTALLGALVGVHFMLFEQYGIMPSRKVMEKAPAVYPKHVWERFNPWFPRNFLYTLQLTLFVWGLILIVPNIIINIPNIPANIYPLFSPAPLVSPTQSLPSGTPAYPPWFFLFLYKALDFLQPSGAPYAPFVASILSGALPALYLLALPWLDRSDYISHHRRKLFTGIGILLITYLIQLSVWGVVNASLQESFSVQVAMMLPPLVLTFLCVYLIPKAVNSKRGERTLSPAAAGLLVVFVLTFFGTVTVVYSSANASSASPIVYFLGLLVPFLLSLALFARKEHPVTAPLVSVQKRGHPGMMTYNVAVFFMVLLFLVSAGILGLMVRLPVTGPQSTYWGVGTGIILLIFSYALSLYAYLYYPQEDDEVRAEAGPVGPVSVRRLEVTGSSGESASKKGTAAKTSTVRKTAADDE